MKITKPTMASKTRSHPQALIAIAVLIAACTWCSLTSTATATLQTSHQDPEPQQQQQQANVALSSKINLSYNKNGNGLRWSGQPSNGGGGGGGEAAAFWSQSMDENEIGTSRRQQYVCGRTIANKKYDKKYQDKLDRELAVANNGGGAHSGAPARTKYRPFEIRTPRIIGGDETSPGEFPWTVSVKLNGQPICGGSLINRNWILTAAHCVVGYNPKNLTVRLGAYRIKDTSERQTIELPISLFIVHKQYSMPRPFSNDIALLKMAESIEYSDYVIPICLPTEDQVTTTQAVNEMAGEYMGATNSRPKLVLSGGTFGPDSGTTTTASTAATAPSSSSSSSSILEPVVEDFDTYDGIVVSTKMSDKQITKCFKRLEQNYLNSIGLGPGTSLPGPGGDDESNSSETDQQQQAVNKPLKQSFPVPPMPVDLIPLKVTDLLKQHPQANQLVFSNSASQAQAAPLSSDSFVGPTMFVTDNNNNNNHIYETNSSSDHGEPRDKGSISFPSFTSDNFELQGSEISAPINQQQQDSFTATTNNQHQANKNHQNHWNNQQQQQQHQVLDSNQYNSNYNGDGLSWRSRASSNGGPHLTFGAAAASADHQQHQQQQAIKLTSLPISKELLREIQSVGSMQSLSLAGLQQSDIVAMASDLSEGGGGGGGGAGNLLSSEPTGNAADRERVISVQAGAGGDSFKRKIVRDADLLLNEVGGDSESATNTAKYSGMTGIVVGWGWVRENSDLEEQQQQVTGIGPGSGGGGGGQRSFQSVTLQKVRLPILRNSDCEAWFRSQEKKITLLPSQFCAGFNSGGKDACRGDSGGPMIIEDSTDTSRYKLIGIVSAGIGCARPSLPGLYTRVASFLPWIHAQMMHH